MTPTEAVSILRELLDAGGAPTETLTDAETARLRDLLTDLQGLMETAEQMQDYDTTQ